MFSAMAAAEKEVAVEGVSFGQMGLAGVCAEVEQYVEMSVGKGTVAELKVVEKGVLVLAKHVHVPLQFDPV